MFLAYLRLDIVHTGEHGDEWRSALCGADASGNGAGGHATVDVGVAGHSSFGIGPAKQCSVERSGGVGVGGADLKMNYWISHGRGPRFGSWFLLYEREDDIFDSSARNLEFVEGPLERAALAATLSEVDSPLVRVHRGRVVETSETVGASRVEVRVILKAFA